MKKVLITLAAAVAAIAPAHAMSPDRVDGEAKLARQLEGRVAGEPVNCIDLRRVRSSRIINDTAIVYEVGSTLYVNRPRSGAESLDNWDMMVSRPFGGRLCRIDVVQLYDASSRMMTGLVFLDKFVPYKRVKTAASR